MPETVTRNCSGNLHTYSDDPWSFATEPDEGAIYGRALEALLEKHYIRALEIGWFMQSQTWLVAKYCDRLLAVNRSNEAINEAKLRHKGLNNVEFARKSVPYDYPGGCFDLTVLSIGDYFTRQDLAALADQITDHTARNGELLLVHWRQQSSDRPLNGDDVHDFFLERRDWMRLAGTTRSRYRIDLFAKALSPRLEKKPDRAEEPK